MMDVTTCQVNSRLREEASEHAARSAAEVKDGLSVMVRDGVTDALVDTESHLLKGCLSGLSRGEGVGAHADADHQVVGR